MLRKLVRRFEVEQEQKENTLDTTDYAKTIMLLLRIRNELISSLITTIVKIHKPDELFVHLATH